jgi:hypothetical protein
MKLRPAAIAGILLILLGVFALWHPVFHGRSTQQTIEVDNQPTILETQRVFSIPRYLSVLVIVTGALFVLDAFLPENEARRRRKGPTGGSRRGLKP